MLFPPIVDRLGHKLSGKRRTGKKPKVRWTDTKPLKHQSKIPVFADRRVRG